MSQDPCFPVPLMPTDEACPHAFDESAVCTPNQSSVVHKKECGYCPRTCEHNEGIYVCLRCFQGMCGEHVGKHLGLCDHPLYLLIKETREAVPAPTTVEGLGVEGPVKTETTLVCIACAAILPENAGFTEACVRGVRSAIAPQVQDQMAVHDAIVNATVCKHCTAGATQQVPIEERRCSPLQPPTASCMGEGCNHTENNWICLSCGYVGCPRAEAGGKMHALLHSMMSGHPLVVKAGTVTAAGADVHCYVCDDEVRPVDLHALLNGIGINSMNAVKTSKTLSEMMIDHTLKYDFTSITEGRKDLVPAYGANCTGLKNFGNTCYMATIVQLLASQPCFQHRFVNGPLADHVETCTAADPHNCYGCQTEKVFKGLSSGDFAQAYPTPFERDRLNGITPTSFKKFFAAGHPMFATADMQDAGEYLGYLLTQIARREQALAAKMTAEAAAAAGCNPPRAFDFTMVERNQCAACSGCSYVENDHSILTLRIPLEPAKPPLGPDGKPLELSAEERERLRPRCSLDDCLSAFLLPSSYSRECSNCKAKGAEYHTTNGLGSFPDVLAIQVVRQIYNRETGQPQKLDCSIDAAEVIDLSRLRAAGPRVGETVWEHRKGNSRTSSAQTAQQPAASTVTVDDVALATLLSIEIPEDAARWALSMTNNDVERAIDFHYSHPEGPPSSAASADAAPAATEPTTGAPLTDGVPQYGLVGLASHIGHSVYTGHWVAHIKSFGRWYIFNDEKVAESQDPPKHLASIYVYRRL